MDGSRHPPLYTEAIGAGKFQGVVTADLAVVGDVGLSSERSKRALLNKPPRRSSFPSDQRAGAANSSWPQSFGVSWASLGTSLTMAVALFDQ